MNISKYILPHISLNIGPAKAWGVAMKSSPRALSFKHKIQVQILDLYITFQSMQQMGRKLY